MMSFGRGLRLIKPFMSNRMRTFSHPSSSKSSRKSPSKTNAKVVDIKETVLDTKKIQQSALSKESTFKCILCDTTGINISKIKEHLKRVHNSLPYPCTHCQVGGFKTFKEYQDHIKTCHKDCKVPKSATELFSSSKLLDHKSQKVVTKVRSLATSTIDQEIKHKIIPKKSKLKKGQKLSLEEISKSPISINREIRNSYQIYPFKSRKFILSFYDKMDPRRRQRLLNSMKSSIINVYYPLKTHDLKNFSERTSKYQTIKTENVSNNTNNYQTSTKEIENRPLSTSNNQFLEVLTNYYFKSLLWIQNKIQSLKK